MLADLLNGTLSLPDHAYDMSNLKSQTIACSILFVNQE